MPSAVVLTVNAYKMFADVSEISIALEVFLQASENADMAALRAASEKCVAAISGTNLPEQIQLQVRG